MKPDVIVVWPRDISYPFFVRRISRDRELFQRVIIVMTEGESAVDVSPTLGTLIKDVIVLKPDLLQLTSGGKDWRNIATKIGLEKSTSPFILFLEQDFFVKDGFFEELFEKGKDFNVVGFNDNERFHPACLLVKKEALDKTSKDFSAYPPEKDHFGKVSEELKSLQNWSTLEALKINGWYHMAGLTHNVRMERRGLPIPYRADEYKLYRLLSQLI